MPDPRLRRLDHVAILVSDTDAALAQFTDGLGLEVAHSEEISAPPARLTYLDCGNAYIQLVEPLANEGPLADWLDRNGDGLHHLCFGVDDVVESVTAITGDEPEAIGSGRGRRSAFIPGSSAGATIEVTEFRRGEDVEANAGWLAHKHGDGHGG
jgi:methylmalonyl-CoA epimerase